MDILKEPQALILLVFMIIAGLKWVLDNIKGVQQGREEDQEETSFTDLYEETRQRIQERQQRMTPEQDEIREQLQQYAPEPAIFEPLSVPPPVPRGVPSPPPIPTQTRRPLSPTATVERPVLSTAERAALERVHQQGMQGAKQRSRVTRTPVRRLLSSPAATRDAIVLREILGPPKGAE